MRVSGGVASGRKSPLRHERMCDSERDVLSIDARRPFSGRTVLRC